MASKVHNPASIGAPIGAYVHGLETPAQARFLHVSGQVGIAPDGSIPQDAEGQARIVWRNIEAILESASMEIGDIVKMTAYLVDPSDLGAYGTVRSQALGEHRPTSTLIFASALVKPELKVEVEIVAARA